MSLNLKQLFFYFISILYAINSYGGLCIGDEEPELKSHKITQSVYNYKLPKSISINAGVPLTGAGDNTGGFGDVAANIQMAVAFKQKYPKMYVQLVVQLNDEFREEVASVEKIINTLMPKINTTEMYKAQDFLGVKVIITPIKSTRDILSSSKLAKPLVKKCELSVQYSANESGNIDLLKATGEKFFTFNEPGAGSEFIDKGHIFQSGLNGAGLYNTAPLHNVKTSRLNVLNFLKETGFDVTDKPNLLLSYAYTKEKNSSIFYQKAVYQKAVENPEKEFIVLVKEGYQEALPAQSNFKIIPLSRFEMTLGNDFIAASDLPPLVTGDSSSATAMLTSRSERFFLYESLPWKNRYIANLKYYIKSRVSHIDLFNYYIDPNKSNKEQEIQKIYKALEPNSETRFIHVLMNKLKKSKDILENTIKIYSVIDSLGSEADEILHSYKEIEAILKPLFLEIFKAASKDELILNIDYKMKNSKVTNYDYAVYSSLKMLLKIDLNQIERTKFINSLQTLSGSEVEKISKIIGGLLLKNESFNKISLDLLELQNKNENVKKIITEILKIEGAALPTLKLTPKAGGSCKSLF